MSPYKIANPELRKFISQYSDKFSKDVLEVITAIAVQTYVEYSNTGRDCIYKVNDYMELIEEVRDFIEYSTKNETKDAKEMMKIYLSVIDWLTEFVSQGG